MLDDCGCKESPTRVKTTIHSKGTKVLEKQLELEFSDDLDELSIAELRSRGLLDGKKNYDIKRKEEND